MNGHSGHSVVHVRCFNKMEGEVQLSCAAVFAISYYFLHADSCSTRFLIYIQYLSSEQYNLELFQCFSAFVAIFQLESQSNCNKNYEDNIPGT